MDEILTTDKYNTTLFNVFTQTDDDNINFSHILWAVIVPIIFSIIILIGTSGNLLVVIVILTNKKMKNLTNILLFNLAIADLTFLLTCVPFQAYKFASVTFPFGDVACKIVQYLLFVTGYVTVYTLVAIAVLRYFTVVRPHASLRYRTRCNVVLTCVTIWLTILLLNIPTIFSHQLHIIQSAEVYISYCGVVQNATEPLFITFFFAGYFIPLIIVSFLYLCIIIHLKQHQVHQSQSDNSRRQQRTSHAFKVIVIVVVVFCISWLPLHAHMLVSLYGKIPGGRFYEVLRVLWYCMAYGNSLVNPVIYTFVSTEFRDSFKKLLISKCCKNVNNACSSGDKPSVTCTYINDTNNKTEGQYNEMKPLKSNNNLL